MAKLYIDTNVFLDFYQSNAETLKIKDAIIDVSRSLVIPRQMIREIERNRKAVLLQLIKRMRDDLKFNPRATSLVRFDRRFKEFTEKRGEMVELGNAMVETLQSMVEDSSKDPIWSVLSDAMSTAKILEDGPHLIENARTRKLLGDPPTSPGKHTVGDELIWETLLAHVKDDLVIASRDRTFLDNKELLQKEFRNKTGYRLLSTTGSLTEAFSLVDASTENAEEIEEANEQGADNSCPECSGALKMTGFEGEDGELLWYFCTECGNEYFPIG